jgi:cell division protein FtsZ
MSGFSEDHMPFTVDDVISGEARIKIIGVGGAGGNAVNNMMDKNLQGVSFCAANTDKQALDKSEAPEKIQLGQKLTNGLGAGGNPDNGAKAAEESLEEVKQNLGNADMIFIAAGMGGGTGTGAAPVIAKVAKETGALTVGIVTKPFRFEGKRRNRQAKEGILKFQEEVDALIVIPNDKLLSLKTNIGIVDAFKRADEVLFNAAKGITELIVNSGYVNVDFMDVRAVMQDKGKALMGIGTFKGDNAAVEAVKNAISSPLLENVSIEGATGILVNITCPPELSLMEISDAAMLIEDKANEDANVIWGTVFDDTLENEVTVTIIATGFDTSVAERIQQPENIYSTNKNGIKKRPAQLTMNYQLNARGEKGTGELPVRRSPSQELQTIKTVAPVMREQDDFHKPAYLRRLESAHNLPTVNQ